MSDLPRHPPAEIPRPILAYHAAAPIVVQRGIVYERRGDALTITIPPRPLATQVVVRTLAFLLCAMPIAGIVLVVLTTAPPTWADSSGLACMAAVALLFAWGSVHTLLRLIHCTRDGRHPSVLHASPAGLEVIAPGNMPALDLRIARDRIATLQVHPGGIGPNPRLILRITTIDDNLYFADLTWCAGYPMIEVEDNLRDVLGLASAH